MFLRLREPGTRNCHAKAICRQKGYFGKSEGKGVGSSIPGGKISFSLDPFIIQPNANVSCQIQAKLLKELHHSNIVQFQDSFLEDGQLIIIMEYCEGMGSCIIFEAI